MLVLFLFLVMLSLWIRMESKQRIDKVKGLLQSLLVVTILFGSFFSSVLVVSSDEIDDYVYLIEAPKDYERYGFKDFGYYYTKEALTQFYMPLVIEKHGKVPSLSKSDLSYKIPGNLMRNSESFNKRNPVIDYRILDENHQYVLILASMTVEASTDCFSIDFVPTIKGQDIEKFAWWNSSWNYKKNITIDHRQVDENLYGFPVLVNITDADLSAHAQSDGDDLVFVGYNNVTILPHEIEYYNNTNGRLVAWVNLTNISSSINTTFYMYYGNSGASSQQDNEGTWDQYYVGVWHCQNLTGNLWDSTGNMNDGAVNGNPTYNQSGLFGRAILMDANSEYFQVTNTASMDFSDNITVYAVYQQIADTDESDYIITTRSGEKGFWIRVAHEGSDGRFEFATGNSSLQAVQTSNTYTSTSEWYHSIGTYNRSAANERRIWIKSFEQTLNSDVNEFGNSNSDWYIGNYLGSSYSMDGYLEELRVSSVVRSDAWITATYNMMVNSSSGGFLTYGSEVDYGNASPSISSYRPADGSTVTNITNVNVSVYIADDESDLFNYTIETSPDIGHRYGNLTTNGTKICNVSGLDYGTTYTVYVNATDPYGSGNWTNITYSFDTIGGLVFYCYDETLPHMGIDFDIEIVNSDGTEVYTANNVSNGHNINKSQMPTGEDTVFVISNSSYETRVYYIDVTESTFLNLSFYLPPRLDTSLKTTSRSVSDPTTNMTITLDCEPDYLVSVQGYNESLYGHWFTIPTNKYSLSSNIITIDHSFLDDNTTVVQVSYYCSPDNFGAHYVVQVRDEIISAISDAYVTISTYINTTDAYTTMLSDFTDGAGQIDVYLIPNTQYYVTITKDGYQNMTAFWTPPIVQYDSDRYKQYVLFYEPIDPNEPENPLEYVTVSARMNTTSLLVNYSSIIDGTINVSVFIYEENLSSLSWSLFDTASCVVGCDTFDSVFSNINTSNNYNIVVFYNHSYWSDQVVTVFVTGISVIMPPTTGEGVDDVFDLYGYNPFGWHNMLMYLFLIAGFYYADQKNTGTVLVMLGGIILFINIWVGFQTAIGTAAGGVVPVLFIVSGIVAMWQESRGRSYS